jgi:hypothetical protein
MLIDDLRSVAAARREELEADLDRARRGLARNSAERLELERARIVAETLLGLLDVDDASAPEGAFAASLTLHEAMAEVLREAPAGMMRAGDLAVEVNRRQLYRMRDGRPVEPQQIHARIGHYGHWFEKEGTFIKLAPGCPLPMTR